MFISGHNITSIGDRFVVKTKKKKQKELKTEPKNEIKTKTKKGIEQ